MAVLKEEAATRAATATMVTSRAEGEGYRGLVGCWAAWLSLVGWSVEGGDAAAAVVVVVVEMGERVFGVCVVRGCVCGSDCC